MPVSKDDTHNNNSGKWTSTLNPMILYRETAMGKKSTGDQSISYDTINVTTPASACAFVQVCLQVWEMSCWQQTAVMMSASEGSSTRGHATTLSVRPRIPLHPFYDWQMTDRVFMLTADGCQAHHIFRFERACSREVVMWLRLLSYRRKNSLKKIKFYKSISCAFGWCVFETDDLIAWLDMVTKICEITWYSQVMETSQSHEAITATRHQR